MTTEQYIPNDSEVQTPQAGRKVWRIADGKIVTGRESEGTLEERAKVVGRLRRVGIYFGTAKDGTDYGQLEADIECAGKEMVRVKTGVTDKAGQVKPSVAALSFAEGLLEIGKDELLVITASQGTKPTKFGNFITYTNIHHLDAESKMTRPVARREPRPDLTMTERWEMLAEEIREHAAYGDRPQSAEEASDAVAEMDGFNAFKHDVMLSKSWPAWQHAEAEYLQMCAAIGKVKSYKSGEDVPESVWGTMRQGLAENLKAGKGLPKLLKPIADKLASAGADDYDPFANE